MNSRFARIFAVMLIVQILLCNFGNFSQYLDLYFVPVMILLLPIRVKTPASLLVAFAAGLTVDFFSDGMLGLRAAALLPVAFFRVRIIGLVFGSGLIAREENISFRKAGVLKIALTSLISTGLFLFVYQILDNAGTVSFGTGTLKFFISLVASTIFSIFIASFFDVRKSSRWN